jgi:hypothetical protein
VRGIPARHILSMANRLPGRVAANAGSRGFRSSGCGLVITTESRLRILATLGVEPSQMTVIASVLSHRFLVSL